MDSLDRIITNYAKAIAVLEKSILDMEETLKMQKELLTELNIKEKGE